MKINLSAKTGCGYQVLVREALFEGFSNLGIKCRKSQTGFETPDKFVSCWGWKRGSLLRSAGKEVLVCERGYLGDRFQNFSLAWNGLNGFGDFGEIGKVTSDRFDKVAKLKPWKQGGDYVLILGQVPGDASLRGKKMRPWYEEKAKQIREIYGHRVLFRPHPEAIKKHLFVPLENCENVIDGTLEELLSNAIFTVTYNSNSAVDSLLAGVPCYSEDEGSMAKEVTSHNIENIVRPEREQWAWQLAHKQWTLEEIAEGSCLKRFAQKILNEQESK